MNIKVCGITQLKQLQQLDGMDIDFAGLIFYKGSPRYVGDKLPAKQVKELDFDIRKVGVFVNAEFNEVLKAIDDYALDVVQLHGDETPYQCEELSEQIEVIKVFSMGNGEKDIDEMVADYDEVCDYYLFDTSVNGAKGGTGKKFDWKKLGKSKIEKPFFLSGGIELEDAVKLKAIKHPDFYGVDINSRFEKEPGIKDMGKVLQFKLALKK
ncbi:MAG TPA: phosphoribosylanthranilate isomerase [Chitinophagaceae bacterium]|nr:phosphoribosylanthranilate isomerase [Chitinophagaceae bacterium]